MATTPHVDVLIAGASFAGLALARALSQALGPAIRIAILDRQALPAATSPADDPRASALAAGSRRMLDQLGVWPLVRNVAQAVHQVEITDSSLDAGIRPVLLTYGTALADGDPAPAMHIVPNGRLLADLAMLVRNDPCIRLIEPAAISAIATQGPRAAATLADGTRMSTALLVAADGRQSSLRAFAGISVVSWSSRQRGIVTTVAHERPHHGHAVQHFLPAGPFAILPLIGDRSCITWSEDASRADAILALDDDAFLAEVEQRFGGRLGALQLAGPRRSWPLDMHLARSYVAPRLALIGDAAHAVHPIAGQGLNLALRDVAALTEAIVDGARLGLDLADPTILERYERWRRFDSAVSAAAFDGLNRLFSSDVRLLRSAREAGLGIVDRLPAVKRWLVAEAAGLNGDVPKLLRGLDV